MHIQLYVVCGELYAPFILCIIHTSPYEYLLRLSDALAYWQKDWKTNGAQIVCLACCFHILVND